MTVRVVHFCLCSFFKSYGVLIVETGADNATSTAIEVLFLHPYYRYKMHTFKQGVHF